MSNSFTNQVIAQIELFGKADELRGQAGLRPAQAPRREGRPPAPRRARRRAHRAQRRAGRLPRHPGRGPLQAGPLPLLGRSTRVPNVYKPTFEEGERPHGFRSRRARIGYELGSELIRCQPLGAAARRGRIPVPLPLRRRGAGDRSLRPPDACAPPRAPASSSRVRRSAFRSARRARTRSSTAARRRSSSWLSRSSGRPDVVVYPDSRQDRRRRAAARRAVAYAPSSSAAISVGYFDGEHPARLRPETFASRVTTKSRSCLWRPCRFSFEALAVAVGIAMPSSAISRPQLTPRRRSARLERKLTPLT